MGPTHLVAAMEVRELKLIQIVYLARDRRPPWGRTAGHNEFVMLELPGGTAGQFVRFWPSLKPIPRGLYFYLKLDKPQVRWSDLSGDYR